jgi:dihydrodipicolinate synthase/N-acetylneuraminate lyase
VELKFTVDHVQGVFGVVPTPATPDAADPRATATVDVAESERMVRRLVEDVVDGILTNGTLGEMATLTYEEWRTFAEVIAETVRDVDPDLPLFVGATTLNTRDTIARMKVLHELGVRGVFLGRPMWCELGPRPMVDFFRDVAEAMPDMSIVIYDNAASFKGPIETETYSQLARIPQIAGVKYPPLTAKYHGDVRAVAGRIRLMPIEFDWFGAYMHYPDEATACWSSSVACGPGPVTYLRDVLRKRDVDEARWITGRIDWTYENFLTRKNFHDFTRYNIPLEKIRFDESGYVRAGPSRPPYSFIPEEYEMGARDNGRRWLEVVREVEERSLT